MANVRKTQELVDAIDSKVRRMSDDAQEPHKQKELMLGTAEYDALREDVLTEMWSAAPQLRNQLPSDWCTTPNRIDVHINDDHGKRIKFTSVDSTDQDPLVCPPKVTSSYAPDHKIKYSNLSPDVVTWVEENKQRAAKCAEIGDQFNTVRQQLAAFMSQHKSLNTALKEMPEIELYVPERFMERYRAKAAPRVKPEAPTNVEELNIDRDSLAAAAIAHRMSQSNAA